MAMVKRGSMMNDRKGFTLVEVLTVIVIMGALMGIAILSMQNMRSRSTVEQQVKQLHSDLLNARMRAMQRDRDHFVSLASTTAYRVYEDGPLPDGDGNFNVADDSLVTAQNLPSSYSMTSNPTMTLVRFTSKGLLSVGTATVWLRITPSADGEYDCVSIDQIRTGMGKINGANCVVK